MSEVPVELHVATFTGEYQAEAILEKLNAAKREKSIGIQGAVVERRNEHGNVHSRDVGLAPGKGGLGSVIGILSDGTGLILGAQEAILGGIVGQATRGSRVQSDHIHKRATSLTPGTWIAPEDKPTTRAGTIGQISPHL